MVESFLQQLQQSDLLLHLAAILSDATHSIWELQHTADIVTVASELASAAYIYQDDISETSSSDLQLQHRHVGQLLICMDNLHCHIEAVKYHSKGSRWHELFLPVALPAFCADCTARKHLPGAAASACKIATVFAVGAPFECMHGCHAQLV